MVAASQRPPDAVAVRYRLEDFAAPVEILTRAPRTLDGAPTAVRIPHRARFVGSTVIARPRAYAVPAAVAAHLARHGLAIGDAPPRVDAELARVEAVATEGGRGILEAGQVGELAVSWRAAAVSVHGGLTARPRTWRGCRAARR